MESSVDDLLNPAQTNLRLYQQLRRLGRDADELAAVRRAHDLVMRIFAGQYRASGKPFIAHLVGTASILAGVGARRDLVLAGLLHASYTHGRFAEWRRALTARKRATVQAAAGTEAEALVLGYTRFEWNAEVPPRLLGDIAGLTPEQRDLVTMRLCNELEDLVNLGIVSWGKQRDGTSQAEVALAERLGLPVLGAALARARRESDAAEVEPRLRNDRASSFTLAPAMHRERLDVRLARTAAGLLARLLGRRSAR